MSNFTDPIKAGFGRYLAKFYEEDLFANTPALAEFAARGFAKCAVWAPGRMIDQVDEMLTAWRKNDTSGQTQPTPYLPIMIAAMAKDYVPAPPDFSRNVFDDVYVTLPNDPKARLFKMRAVVAEVRTQVVIVAAEEATARSLAAQLHAFAGATENRRFGASYRLVGLDKMWPVVLEHPDLQAINSPVEVSNLTILAMDFSLRATVPMLRAPKVTEPNDGQGSDTVDDPDGYLVVTRADGTNAPSPTYQHPETWTEGGP